MRFLDLNGAVSSCEMDQINALADELSAVADQAPVAVVLDFEGKEFVPVAAFEGVLFRLHKRLSGRLSMSGLPVNVIEHFDTNRRSTVFMIHPNMDAAIESSSRI